jgi:hypothetical protein
MYDLSGLIKVKILTPINANSHADSQSETHFNVAILNKKLFKILCLVWSGLGIHPD